MSRFLPSLLIGCMVFHCTGPSFAWPQTPVVNRYLFRLEKIDSEREVCALVFGDGHYRWEEARRDNVVVMEDALSPAVLANFRELIDKKELREVTQEKIPVPWIASGLEQVFLSVRRDTVWQNLEFPAPESRHTVKAILEPLLNWLDAARNASRYRLSDSDANNCLPPKTDFALKVRPSAPSTPRASTDTQGTPSPSDYLLWWEGLEFIAGTGHRKCGTIHASGKYHFERISQDGSKKPRVFEDLLKDGELRRLREILNDAKLSALKPTEPLPVPVFTEAKMWRLSIPRSDGIQHISTTSFFGVPGSVTNSGYTVSPNEQELRPLLSWIHEVIEKRKVKSVENEPSKPCVLPHF